jgi:riboflavin synthase
MFTGIIKDVATLQQIVKKGSNVIFTFKSNVANELKVDESVSHNGICLTVESIENNYYTLTAVAETIAKTNIGFWEIEDTVNIERAMLLNARLDGHLVQGHIDTTALCTNRVDVDGSWLFSFEFSEDFAALVIEKGSICINGISLTLFNVGRNSFDVTVIPYTFNHTNINSVFKGTVVNLEFDMVGKYIQRMQSLK